MFRLWKLSLAAIALGALAPLPVIHGQAPNVQTNPDAKAGPTGTAGGITRNVVQTGQPVAAANKITQPMPLSAKERESALEGIDRHLTEEAVLLKARLKSLLPDELSVLAKTAGWKQEHQNALLVALRAGDPAAVYEAWTQGNPQDAAGAEIVARQTDVKRTFARLEQNVQNHAPIQQDLVDLETSLSKIAPATPPAGEVVQSLGSLKTWAEIRKLVETAIIENGPTAKLPNGKVPLIYEASLDVGKAIVLGNSAVMIGNRGRGPTSLRMGNAAEALGMPLVTGKPVPDAEGQQMTDGVLLVNPHSSKGTITYNVNGNRYVMEPGMAQRLPEAARWTVEYDKGGNYGPAAYTVTDGTYHFTPTDGGWQLFKQRFDVTLDNSQNAQEFSFLMNGEAMAISASGTRTISSIYPMVVRYDRGNGTELAAKVLNFSGNVQVGVNAVDNRWDIFPTTEGQREVSNLKLFQ